MVLRVKKEVYFCKRVDFDKFVNNMVLEKFSLFDFSFKNMFPETDPFVNVQKLFM